MPIGPRETITRHFIVEDGTGAPVDADETPTAILRRNGAVCTNADITVTSTGTTGEYRVSATLSADDGWEEGDSYALIAQAVVSGTTFRRIVEQGNVEDLPPRRESYTDERAEQIDLLAGLPTAVASADDISEALAIIVAALETIVSAEDIASIVWSETERTLTDLSVEEGTGAVTIKSSQITTLSENVASAVWNYVDRRLTTTLNAIGWNK